MWPDPPELHDASTATIADWSASLQRLSSDTAAIAREAGSATVTQGDGAEGDGTEGDGVDELTTWATAAVATAESHRRDLALVGTLDGVGAELTLAELADQARGRSGRG